MTPLLQRQELLHAFSMTSKLDALLKDPAPCLTLGGYTEDWVSACAVMKNNARTWSKPPQIFLGDAWGTFVRLSTQCPLFGDVDESFSRVGVCVVFYIRRASCLGTGRRVPFHHVFVPTKNRKPQKSKR